MNIKSVLLFLAITALTIPTAIPVQAAEDEMTRIQQSIRVLEESKDNGIPRAYLRDAAAVAIIPNMVKGALIVGAERGSGVLLVQEGKGNWSDPIFISTSGASLGPQLGVESTDIVMVFNTRKSVDNLLEGQVKLGADATIAAGDLDAQAKADTGQDIIAYRRTGGVFAGASLSGAVVQVENDANEDYYGAEDITGTQILAGLDKDVPDSSKQLKDVLKRYIDREK